MAATLAVLALMGLCSGGTSYADIAIGGNGDFSHSGGRSAYVDGNNPTNGSIAIGDGAHAHGGDDKYNSTYRNQSLARILETAVGTDSDVSGAGASAFGARSEAHREFTTAIGDQAHALWDGATAVGAFARAGTPTPEGVAEDADSIGWYATAVGNGSNASNNGSTALGHGANATGLYATAAGEEAAASGAASQAAGYEAKAAGDFANALGAYAEASGYSSQALGPVARADGDHSTAIGVYSNASGNYSMALGAGAAAANDHSVALGYDSSTSDAVDVSSAVVNGHTFGNFAGSHSNGVVSVGNAAYGETRQIQNVSAGRISPDSTDAVNGSQLYAVASSINGNTDALSHRISDLDNKINRVGAGAAALAALHPGEFDRDAKWSVSAGYGNYVNASAAAVGAFYRPNADTLFSFATTVGNNENMFSAGVSLRLGHGSPYSSMNRSELIHRIQDQDSRISSLEKQIQDQNERMARLEALVEKK